MEGAGILELIAELAVAILGFSGIVTAVFRFGDSGFTAVDRVRFFTMVLLGSLVVVLALLPFPVHYLGAGEQALWAWSSALGAATIFAMNRMVRRASGFSIRQALADPTVSRTAVMLGVVGTPGSVLVLVVASTGLVFAPSFAIYLIVLLFIFGNSLFAFVRLLQSIVRAHGGDANDGPLDH